MATKKRSLEEFMASMTEPQAAPDNYVTAPKSDWKQTAPKEYEMEKNGNKVTKNVETKKESMELAPLEAELDVPEPKPIIPSVKESIKTAMAEPVAQPQVVKETVTTKTPNYQRAEGPSAWERAMIGATPLLVGLLSGNPLEGTQVAGNQLAGEEGDRYKRQKDLDTKLSEMQMKRDFASVNPKATNYARETLIDPETGKPTVYSIVNGQKGDALGEAVPKAGAGPKVSYKTLMNPQTQKAELAELTPGKEPRFLGEAEVKQNFSFLPTTTDEDGKTRYQVVNKHTGQPLGYLQGTVPAKPMQNAENGRNERFQQQKMVDITKEFIKPNSIFNKKKDNLDGLVTAADMLNSNNPQAINGVRNFLARNVFGEKGPLSDSDIARLAGDPAYSSIMDRIIEARTNGTIPKLDRSDIRQVLEIAYTLESQRAKGEAGRFGKAFATNAGFDPTPGLQQYVNGAIMPLPPFNGSNGLRDGGVPQAGKEEGGFVFKGGDPTKKENWEKK